jgi:hypothetical protein
MAPSIGVSSASELTSLPAGSQLHGLSLLFTDSITTLSSISNCSLHNISARTAKKTPFMVVFQSFPGEHVCLRRSYSVTAAYIYLLRICCLEADVVSLFVSRSLPSNGSARYNITQVLLSHIYFYCAFIRHDLILSNTHLCWENK